ncbi:hypothetical protein BDV93DRAFT_563898 [Ceratobasidium sp. AG-I]|nr:hypothetical protein BDV93DRAFT_563898 [Ceratobasidium sp. AG-I]
MVKPKPSVVMTLKLLQTYNPQFPSTSPTMLAERLGMTNPALMPSSEFCVTTAHHLDRRPIALPPPLVYEFVETDGQVMQCTICAPNRRPTAQDWKPSKVMRTHVQSSSHQIALAHAKSHNLPLSALPSLSHSQSPFDSGSQFRSAGSLDSLDAATTPLPPVLDTGTTDSTYPALDSNTDPQPFDYGTHSSLTNDASSDWDAASLFYNLDRISLSTAVPFGTLSDDDGIDLEQDPNLNADFWSEDIRKNRNIILSIDSVQASMSPKPTPPF